MRDLSPLLSARGRIDALNAVQCQVAWLYAIEQRWLAAVVDEVGAHENRGLRGGRSHALRQAGDH